MPVTSPIYQKTAKGSQAIATRDHALGPKLRSLLIMVDGKRSTEELARFSGALGDAAELLAQLEGQGFIEVAGGRATGTQAAAPPAPAPASTVSASTAASTVASTAASTAAMPTVTLAEAKRFAVRRLTDILGPTGESLCMRIEGARSAQEFLQHLAKAEHLLRDFGGAKLAESFSQDMQSRRPG